MSTCFYSKLALIHVDNDILPRPSLGYLRDPHDRTRCRASSGRASLLFAHKTDVRRVALDRRHSTGAPADVTSIVNETRYERGCCCCCYCCLSLSILLLLLLWLLLA